MSTIHDHDPLRPHRHDPNPAPPSPDPAFALFNPDRQSEIITPDDLALLPQTESKPLFIVTTSHGTSGPFRFGGVALFDLLQQRMALPERFQVEAVSGDGFGTRIEGDELLYPHANGPILLSTHINGVPLIREQGLVRLIVPSETDDALRQVKWVTTIRVVIPPTPA
ncbi:MAG: molybdopterin-dependent oxidoreductase [Anaerolineae bacterium]|nr:molybdopterin-dependent oxidoreductase [Anaerolineae bacterium]